MKAQTVPDARGLVPATHVFLSLHAQAKAWVPGTRPGVTPMATCSDGACVASRPHANSIFGPPKESRPCPRRQT
jgi:hypothetical protein